MIIEQAQKVLAVEAQAIERLIPRIDEHFIKAIELLLDCKGRVIVTGMGKSGLVGKKIAATLASTGTPSFFLHPAEGIHGDLGMVTADDVVISLSNSVEKTGVECFLPIIKEIGDSICELFVMNGGILVQN